MDHSWITLHRKILDHCIFKDSETLHLFMYCLIRANHKSNTFLFNGKEITIKRGQFITGRNEIQKATKIKSSSIYRKLKILENLEILNIKPNNKFSLITILKYNTYQGYNDKQTEQQLNNKRTTTEQQLNTNNNDNNVNNDNNELLLSENILENFKDSREAKEILVKWNSFALLNDLPKCMKLTADRAENLQNRLKENDFDFDIILTESKKSEWLMNKDPKLNLDFLISSDINYIKILEGKFKNGKNKSEITGGNFNTGKNGFKRNGISSGRDTNIAALQPGRKSDITI